MDNKKLVNEASYHSIGKTDPIENGRWQRSRLLKGQGLMWAIADIKYCTLKILVSLILMRC